MLWKLRLIPSFSILILIGHRFAACGKVVCDGSSWHPIPSTINSSNLFNLGISTVTLQIIKGVPSHASSTDYQVPVCLVQKMYSIYIPVLSLKYGSRTEHRLPHGSSLPAEDVAVTSLGRKLQTDFVPSPQTPHKNL